MKILVSLIIVYALFLNTACDKMKSAVDASARLARQVENLVDKNEQSFNDGLYDKTTALKIAAELKKAIPAARDFNAAVRALKAETGAEKPTRAQFDRLAEMFYAVERPMRDVLVIYGALSSEQNAYLETAIAAIRQAIGIIRDSFSLAEIQLAEAEKQWT